MLLVLIRQDGLAAGFEVFLDFRVDFLAADDDAVGIIDGGFRQADIIGLLEMLKVFGIQSWQFQFLVETGFQRFGKVIIINGIDDFRFVEQRIVPDGKGTLDVNRHKGREPSVAVNHIGRPVEFLHRFDDTAREENAAVVVLFAENSVKVVDEIFFL